MRLRAEALEVSYGGRPVLRGVDLAVPSGTFAAVIGPNGAGKSSLLRALQGWQPCRGQVRLDETNLHAMRQADRARHVGYLPQDNAVRSSLTVLDVVVLGRIEGLAWWLSRDAMESAIDALGRLRLLHIAAAGDLPPFTGGGGPCAAWRRGWCRQKYGFFQRFKQPKGTRSCRLCVANAPSARSPLCGTYVPTDP